MIEHEDHMDSNGQELREDLEERLRAREAAGAPLATPNAEEAPPAEKPARAERRHNVIMAGVLAMTALSFSKDPEPWVWSTVNIFGLCCLVYALLDWLSESQA